MNSWASAAAKQLFENWTRCGVSYIPKSSAEGSQKATAWLEDQNLQLGVAEAERLGLHSSNATLSTHTPNSVSTNGASISANAAIPNTASTDSSQHNPNDRGANLPGASTSAELAAATPATSPPAAASPGTRAPTHLRTNTSLGSSATNWTTSPLEVDGRNERFRLLSQQVSICKLCTEIACRRNKTVFGVGPTNARIVMFGEAPGADEDRTGEPFVGAAGQLMDKILIASGLKRDEVYIMNALKCRPPNNRTPIDTEIDNCRPFFETQLETIQPEYIICWGAVAVRAILNSKESIGRLRGKFHRYKGAKVLVTYHPSYLLRNPDAKKLTWEDMKFLMKELGIPIPPPKRAN